MDIVENLAKLRELKTELKRHTDVYDYSAKRSVAEWNGLDDLEIYYYLPFDDWLAVKQKFLADIDDMSVNIREVEKFHKMPENSLGNVAFKDWHNLYLDWKKQ